MTNYKEILSFTVRTEAAVLWMNLVELATLKKARNIKAFARLTPKIPIPQGVSKNRRFDAQKRNRRSIGGTFLQNLISEIESGGRTPTQCLPPPLTIHFY